MIRVMVSPGTIAAGAELELDDSDLNHLRVRRVESGAEGEALDGRGNVARGRFLSAGGGWTFQVELTLLEPRPAETVLVVGAGDRDRFLLLAEKVAELGVTRLVPLETTHSRSVENRVRDSVVDKARRRTREACKQSGNPWLPLVDDIRPLEGLSQVLHGGRWLLAKSDGGALPEIGGQESVGWLIGPEAGFGLEEIDLMDTTLSPTPVALGQHILRFETAAIAAAVVTDMARMNRARARRG